MTVSSHFPDRKQSRKTSITSCCPSSSTTSPSLSSPPLLPFLPESEPGSSMAYNFTRPIPSPTPDMDHPPELLHDNPPRDNKSTNRRPPHVSLSQLSQVAFSDFSWR